MKKNIKALKRDFHQFMWGSKCHFGTQKRHYGAKMVSSYKRVGDDVNDVMCVGERNVNDVHVCVSEKEMRKRKRNDTVREIGHTRDTDCIRQITEMR